MGMLFFTVSRNFNGSVHFWITQLQNYRFIIYKLTWCEVCDGTTTNHYVWHTVICEQMWNALQMLDGSQKNECK